MRARTAEGEYALTNGAPFAGEAPRAFSSPPPGEYAHHHHFAYGGAGGGQYPPFMNTPTHAHEGYGMPPPPQQHEQDHHHQQQQDQQQQHGYHRQEYHEGAYEAPRRQERSESSASEGSELERGMSRLAVLNSNSGGHTPGHTNSSTPANANPINNNTNSGPGANAPISIPGSGSAGGSGGGSPQLASPASSGASAGRAVDQNPPINTLYVGNLPTLAPGAGAGVGVGGGAGGLTMEYLESALRELFGACAGFRQMSFRPKGNGPMCFVEFEDVGYATKTLNELYGNTLGGLIKGGGIRLSYSKNRLGQQQGMSLSLNLQQQQQQQGALAEAAFHPRLTSPPPLPPPEAAPRFFGAAAAGWRAREWERERGGVGLRAVCVGAGAGGAVRRGAARNLFGGARPRPCSSSTSTLHRDGQS
ncbi:hypothetical protein DFH09DRAFT_1316046 [Mycena vulgaris]|nr:hypothetical protein DFH09DRAFT_1316046 [Mycena vulgaris]